MAVRCLVGVPGAGKTFFIVHWLVTLFCVQLKKGGYVLDPSRRIRVVTNVAELQIPHDDFQTCLDAVGGFEEFFTKEYQAVFSAGYDHVIYILDECHEWFHLRHCRLTQENILYFTWARHEGHDLWFITQDQRLLMQEVSCLSEEIIQAQPRSSQVFNEFSYVYFTSAGTETRTQRLVFSKKIASLYQSAKKQEAVKIKNYRMRKYMAALFVAFLLMFFGLRSTYQKWQHFMHPGQEQAQEVANSSASVEAAAAVPNSSAASSAAPAKSASGMVSDLAKPASSEAEWYMYRLDSFISGGVLYFRLGISWIPYKEFPYLVVLRGKSYFAMMPSILINSLDDDSRALPIRTTSKTEG